MVWGFSNLETIQLLQRWILVQSFTYYELNDNLVDDHTYDNNVRSLFEYRSKYPEDYAKSRYALIFENYEEGCTSGFELIERVRKYDPELYRHIHIDAAMALDTRNRRNQ